MTFSSLLGEERRLVREHEWSVQSSGRWSRRHLWLTTRDRGPATAPSSSAGALGDTAVIVNLGQFEQCGSILDLKDRLLSVF